MAEEWVKCVHCPTKWVTPGHLGSAAHIRRAACHTAAETEPSQPDAPYGVPPPPPPVPAVPLSVEWTKCSLCDRYESPGHAQTKRHRRLLAAQTVDSSREKVVDQEFKKDPPGLSLPSALAGPDVSRKIQHVMQWAPAFELFDTDDPLTTSTQAVLRLWVEDARLTTVEPDVGAVESYFWAADLSKLHATANWPVLRGFVLRACGGRAQASQWQSLLLAQVVHAMKMQWTEDEQHTSKWMNLISKWLAEAGDSAAFKESHLAILRHIVDPEAYLGPPQVNGSPKEGANPEITEEEFFDV